VFTTTVRLRSRGTGLTLFALGLVIVLAYVLVPVPDKAELERRQGTVVDARRERFSPCRELASDCFRTIVEVRDANGTRTYNFAQVAVSDVTTGAAIDLDVAPIVKGFDYERVWQAEQNGRRLIDYEHQARTDRRIIAVLLTSAPLFMIGGLLLARRYDW
jgi:hypothetical protein